MTDFGIPIVTSSLVPKGTVFIIDPAKLTTLARPEIVITDDELKGRFLSHMRLHVGFDFGPTVEEADPFWRKPPQDFHGALRWLRSVIAYDWRKLRGRLRRYPKSAMCITGVVE